MSIFGHKSVLINSIANWGVTAEENILTIPGFGSFDSSKCTKQGGYAATAPVEGVYTFTPTRVTTLPSTVNLVFDVVSSRESADNVRFKADKGRTFVVSIALKGNETATVICDEVRKQLGKNANFPFVVTGTATVIFTAKSEYVSLKEAHTGRGGAPYVEDAVTQKAIPGGVTTVFAVTTEPATAIGLGKDIEEDEFLATAFSVQPYGEEITDRPYPTALYAELHFNLNRVNAHEVQGAPSSVLEGAGFSVYLLKSDLDAQALAFRQTINSFANVPVTSNAV